MDETIEVLGCPGPVINLADFGLIVGFEPESLILVIAWADIGAHHFVYEIKVHFTGQLGSGSSGTSSEIAYLVLIENSGGG